MRIYLLSIILFSAFYAFVCAAQTQFINNSPDPLFSSVSIEFHGKIVVKALEYRGATQFLDFKINGFDSLKIISDKNQEEQRTLPIIADETTPLRVIIQGVGDPEKFSANPNGRDISLVAYAQSAKIKADSPTESEISFLFGSPDAPVCSLNAVDVAPLVKNGSFGDSSPYPAPMPAMSYTFSLVEELPQPVIRRLFEVNLGSLSGKSGLVLLSGFWDPTANNNGKPLALLLIAPDGSVEECSSVIMGITDYSPANRISALYDRAAERVVCISPKEIISAALFGLSGIATARSNSGEINACNSPDGLYFLIARASDGSVSFGRVTVCR